MTKSGVKVNPKCVEEFETMKLRHVYKFLIYKLTPDLSKIEIECRETHPKDAKVFDLEDRSAYEKFLEALPKNSPRYAVYDLNYTLGESGERNKLFFLLWCPDNASVREKMVISSSKDELRKQLNGISHEFQGSEISDIDLESIAKTVSKNFTA